MVQSWVTKSFFHPAYPAALRSYISCLIPKGEQDAQDRKAAGYAGWNGVQFLRYPI